VTGRQITHIQPRHNVQAIAFAPQSPLLIVAGANSRMTMWRTDTGQFVSEIEHATSPFALSPDGELLAVRDTSGFFDGAQQIRVVRIPEGRVTFCCSGHRIVSSLAFTPQSCTRAILATAGDDGIIKLWDCETGTELVTLTGHSGAVLVLGFSPDGRTLASGGVDAKIRLWDLSTNTEHASFTMAQAVRDLAFASDGMTLVVGLAQGGIRLLRLPRGLDE